MIDVLMTSLMIATIAAFAAYVWCCDRIIGRNDPATDARSVASAAPTLSSSASSSAAPSPSPELQGSA